MKRNIKTTKKQIADFWIKNNNICETELNFDWADCYTHCWTCGDDKGCGSKNDSYLERCHIIPHSLNGKDEPDNYVLLCHWCHSKAPNTSNKNDMWDWIKSNYMPYSLYGTYGIRKALIMYEQRNGHSFLDKALGIKNISKVLNDELLNISTV